ncbi:MAG: helix-turn-helix transcriptional regulator [Candidatus Margulisiibacteriota bacterium]|jgi:transcriptional regulator with XRE-family HTH domain
MNLIQAFYFIKKFFNYSNEDLADHLGISRQQVSKIMSGHKGVNASILKRISVIMRISLDELMDNPFLPPSYHFSKHIYSTYYRCEIDYPEFFFKKEDVLYIRPFIHENEKIGQFILVWQNKTYTIEQYKGDPERYASEGKNIHFHIVGQSRFLYRPIEDIEYQRQIEQELKPLVENVRRKGRPIKMEDKGATYVKFT